MLDAVVREQTGESWGKARTLVRRGKVRVNGMLATEITHGVRPEDEVVIDREARRIDTQGLPADAFLHVDPDIVVVVKPVDILTLPYDNERGTLVDLARMALQRQTTQRRGGRAQRSELGVVQRLDKQTSGVLVFARTFASKRELQRQFREHTVERRYLAIVHGTVTAPFTSDTMFIRDRGDGLKGSWGVFRRPRGPVPSDAQRAVTHVRPLRALRGATLVECRLETGRQHQIRVHLSERGHALVGEPVYIRDQQGPRIEAARPMLHAAVLGFAHPRTGETMRFEVPPPPDFQAMLQRL